MLIYGHGQCPAGDDGGKDARRSDAAGSVRAHRAGRRGCRHQPGQGIKGLAAGGVEASARAGGGGTGDQAARGPPHPLSRRAERIGAADRLARPLPDVLARPFRKSGTAVEGNRVMGETRAIEVEKVLPYTPEKIWRTLTTGELIAKWLMPNDFAAVVGHRFNFRTRPIGDWDGVVHCEVLACDPPRLLRYSWKGGSDPNPAKGSR